MLGFAVRYGDSCKVEIESFIKHFCHHIRCCYAFCKAGFEPGAGWTFETSITLVCNCTKWKHYESIKRIAVLCPDILLLEFRQNELFFLSLQSLHGRTPRSPFYPTIQWGSEHSRTFQILHGVTISLYFVMWIQQLRAQTISVNGEPIKAQAAVFSKLGIAQAFK